MPWLLRLQYAKKVLSALPVRIKIILLNSALLDRTALEEAAFTVARYLRPTPLVRSSYFSELTGADVWLKLESLQPTHSFKVRGAINAVAHLSKERRDKGVVTASGGNHGLGVALASRLLETTATVYLPAKTPELKVKALEGLGAEIILHGSAWDEANALALMEAEKNDLAYIHPFNDSLVMAGQGTMIKEIVEDTSAPKPDLIIASIGGGGLISGIISAVRSYLPSIRVCGVETRGADCMKRSVEAGEIVELDRISSIADSLGARRTEERPFSIIKDNITELAVVEDKAAVEAAFTLLEEEKLLAEPAASCCLAALSNGQIAFSAGETIVVIVCGANISLEKLQSFRHEL